MEEVHAVAQLESADVEVVEDVPEFAHVVDVGEDFEAVFVGVFAGGGGGGGGLLLLLRAVLPVVPEVPAVDEGWGAVLLEAGLQEVAHFCAAGWGGGCGGFFGGGAWEAGDAEA